MRRLSALATALAITLAGCVATMTPYGTTIEPLVDVYFYGPPVVVAPPPSVVVSPLPRAVIVPDRRVYYYNSAYYYYWGDNWYWRRGGQGPWHPLERKYWPPQVEHRGGGRH